MSRRLTRRPGRALASALVFILFATVVVTPFDAEAQEASSEVPTTSVSAIDRELYDALSTAGLLDDWLAASPVSDEAAFVHVQGSESYDDARAELLATLADVGRGEWSGQDRLERLDQLDRELDTLDGVLGAIDISIEEQAGADVWVPRSGGVRSLRVISHFLGFSRDPLVIAERHMGSLRIVVEAQLRRDGPARSPSSAASWLARMRSEVDGIRDLTNLERSQTVAELAAAGPALEAIRDSFPAIHATRLRAESIVGLPVVTLDAYLRGAADLERCPVEWNLLAGIGRIESRHGTVDGAEVGTSGRLTVSIFGPLLDGGATERELVEAEATAEAEALAAELALAAEEAARLAAIAEYTNQLFGVVEEDDSDPTAGGEPLYSDLAEDQERDPLYGQVIEGGDDEADAETDAAASDEDGENEDAEGKREGNGFAVIKDTDNGRLDGNARWDRAVGPMQFIPETWSNWSFDGNGDGVADPQNLYDAALSAGNFLCHLSKTRGPSPFVFVLGYNSSNTYVRNVMAFADVYGTADLELPE